MNPPPRASIRGRLKLGGTWHFLALHLLLVTATSAHFNIFLSKEEVRKLFGVGAELYYVREGVKNTYALNFVVPVPANVTQLNFNWQALMKRPMSYEAQVRYDNVEAMSIPTLNISSRGFVPVNITQFSLTLPCSGKANSEVEINLTLNITTPPRKVPGNVTNVTIRRKKICLKGETFLPQNKSKGYKPTPLFVAVAIAATSTILVLTLVALVYLKLKRDRERQALNCRYYSEPSYLGDMSTATGRGLTSGKGLGTLSLRSNSYATIASLKKFPFLTSGSQTYKNQNKSGSDSGAPLYYASSPLSHLYPKNCSDSFSPSLSHMNSGLSQNSWCSPKSLHSMHSQSGWKDPRKEDPTERIKQLTVDRWRILVGDLLQEGTFGRIHQGICHDPLTQQGLNVLVKTVSGNSSSTQAQLMLREGLLLAGLRHPNLMSLLGLCTQDSQRPLLLYPYMEQTNLKLYLSGCSSNGMKVEGKKLMTRDAVEASICVCQGLIYLHQRRILHKDIATRNCLVNKEYQVKLTDTALSRDLFPEDYHCLGDNENRPIKWLSMESVIFNRYTTASDVWMFSVLLWELITSAQQPYLEIDPFEMGAYLRDGYRLSQPHSCPDDLFNLMAICWAPSPEDRPTLIDLNNCLKELHAALGIFV